MGESKGTAATAATTSDEFADLIVEGAPPLSAVVDATLRAAGLADDPVPGWRTRSRWSALVPTIGSRVGNSQSWRDVTDPTVNRALSYDVRVSWRLERLIYDPNEPRFAAFDISRRRERRRLIALATHAYVAWVHARSAEILATHDQADDSPGDVDDDGRASESARDASENPRAVGEQARGGESARGAGRRARGAGERARGAGESARGTDESARNTGERGSRERADGRHPISRAAPRAARSLIEARLARAELDALTDGWFSQMLTKAPRS